MQRSNELKLNKARVLNSAFGSLLPRLPTIFLVTATQPAQVLNLCPKVYYEESLNSRDVVLEGCPPNAATQRLRGTTDTVAGQRTLNLPGANVTPDSIIPADTLTTPGQVVETGIIGRGNLPATTNPPGTPTTLPIKPPLPENRNQAVATVMPMNGTVSVKLKINTNALVNYKAVGYTQRPFLVGGQQMVLRNLPAPVNVTFVQQDKGFIEALPLSASTGGVLEVGLSEDASPLLAAARAF